MGVFSELDIIIKEYAKTTEEIEALTKEINAHIHNGKDFEQLSYKAQEIVIRWEEMEMMI